jgi:hypothetical protein
MARSVRVLAGLGDGLIGPSPRVMNIIYIYIYIYIGSPIETLGRGCCTDAHDLTAKEAGQPSKDSVRGNPRQASSAAPEDP